MIADLALAQLCADAYAGESSWDHVWDFSGTHLTHRKIDDTDYIVFRGSFDVEDWIHDVEAFPVWDSRLGFVHGGFLIGMNDALDAVQAAIGPRVVVTGHSLGGARARILAALLAHGGHAAAKCTVFGSPRPAFANLGRVLQKSATPLASYRNRNDPVPLVPFLGGLYEHPDAWQSLSSAPAADDLTPLRDHHIGLYITALGAPVTPTGAPELVQA